MPVTDDGLGSQVAKIDDQLIILIDTDRTLSGVITSPGVVDALDAEEFQAEVA